MTPRPLPLRRLVPLLAVACLAASFTLARAEEVDLRRIGQFLQGDIAASADGERARQAIKAPPELYAQLSFEPAEEISEVVQMRFAQEMGEGLGDGGARLLDTLSTGAVLRAYDAQLARAGYSATNLIDVMAAYLLQSWQLTQEAPSDWTAMLRPVRYQLMRAFATEPAVAELPDAEQQQLAEQMIYSVSLAAQVSRTLAARGDADAMAAFRASIADGVQRTSGFDLRRVRATAQGFVPLVP